MLGLLKKNFMGLLISIVNASDWAIFIALSNKNARFNLPLSIYILMNTVKNLTTIHLQLN